MPDGALKARADEGRPWWWTASIVALASATILFRASDAPADPDLWGNLRLGEDVWRHGPAHVDAYSYVTGGAVWVNHEWLSEALMAGVYRSLGDPGVIVLKTAIALIIFWALFAHVRARGAAALGAAVIAAYAMTLVMPGLRSLRPQAFTYLCFLAVLLVIDRADRGDRRWLWATPAIFACWANLHGGVAAGAVLLIWAVFRLGVDRLGLGVRDDRASLGPPITVASLALVIAACAAATLLNPHGVGLWSFLARSLGPRPEIDEWTPVNIATAEGYLYLASTAIATAGLIGSRRERRPALVLLFVGAVFLPLMARRHAPLFIMTAVIVCGEHVADAFSAWTSTRRRARDESAPEPGRATDRFLGLCAGAMAAEAVLLLALAAPHFRQITYRAGDAPVGAVRLLEASGVDGNLAVFFDWGHYVIWHLTPRIKVSMDGRRETLYSPSVYGENASFMLGLDEWDALITKRDTHFALVSKAYAVNNLLRLTKGWSLIYEDGHSALFARDATPQAARLRAAAAAVGAVPADDDRIPFP